MDSCTVYPLELLDYVFSFCFVLPWAGITYKKLIHYLSTKKKKSTYKPDKKLDRKNLTARKPGVRCI